MGLTGIASTFNAKIAIWQFDKLLEDWRPFERCASTVVPSAVIDLTEGFAAYEEKLQVKSARFCKNLHKKTDKLESEAGELRFVMDSRDIAELRILMRWKSDQCRRKGWVDFFDRPWVIDVTDYLFSTHNDWFGGLLSLLYAGEIPAAAFFGSALRNSLCRLVPRIRHPLQQVLSRTDPVYADGQGIRPRRPTHN